MTTRSTQGPYTCTLVHDHDDDDDDEDDSHDDDDDDDLYIIGAVCMSVCMSVTKRLTFCIQGILMIYI